MKKLSILLILLLSVIMYSQTKVLQPTLRAGVNISEINGVKGEKKTDFYLGAALALNLSKFYTLQPELTYSNQGGSNIVKRERNYNGQTGEYEYTETIKDVDLEYLSISIANKFYVTPKRDFNLLIAPSFDILVANKSHEPENNNGGYQYYNHYDNISDVDLTMTVGAGYDFPFGLGIDARYKLGVINVLDTNFLFSSDGSSKNRVIQVGLNYKFNSNNN